MYVIHGACLIETKDASIAMKKGEFILIDANIEHRLQVDKERPCRMLNVEFGFYEEDTNLPAFHTIVEGSETLKYLLHSDKPYFALKDSDEVYITLKSLIMELNREDSNENLLVQLLFDQLLIRISRLYYESGSKNPGPGVIHVKKAMQYIHQHYDRDIQIKDIAAAANVHSGYLHRIFRNNKGCTINEYLMQFRMEKAKTLLANTDIQISDISDYVGINSRQYFAFVFKKYTGLSPSSYRRSMVQSSSKN
jgi:YesN/AraC family two-component response regulator